MSVEVLAGSKVPVVEVHALPCSLRVDGDSEDRGALEANTPTYWRPSRPDPDRPDLVASFRGRELNGVELTLPSHYKGYVIDEFRRAASDKSDRKFFVGGKFDRFTYWNWNRPTSRDDPVRRALDWIDVADALHDPIDSIHNAEDKVEKVEQ